jgi:hypothetical protein
LCIHGGGTTGITQVNDTDLHQHLRRRYSELETADLLKQARLDPKATPIPRPENCIQWMASVWADPSLHVNAAKGFWSTGIANALDGSQDHLIVREAKQFHVALEIPSIRQQLLLDVAEEVRDGRLWWSYEKVFSLVQPFAKTGVLDSLVDFQDDELVVEDGEPPWAEPASDSDDELASDAEELEPGVQALGPMAAVDNAPGVQALGPMAAEEAGPRSTLSPHQADQALAAAHRLSCLKRALDAISELPDPGDPGLEVTLKRAMHAEERRAFGRQQEHPEVAQALQRMHQEERQDLLRQRHAIEERARLAQQAKDLNGEVKSATEKLKQKKAEIESHAAVLECKQAAKSYTPEMFGQGRKNGGDSKHRKERSDALDRLAKRSPLSAEQRNDWDLFKSHWDAHQSKEHGDNWGKTFAELLQALLRAVQDGEPTALSKWMQQETRLFLKGVVFVRM